MTARALGCHCKQIQVAGQEAGQDLQNSPSPDSYEPEEVAAAVNASNVEEEEVRQGFKGQDGPQEAWAKEELAALNADEAISTPNSVNYALNVLWLERNIGMAVDQVFGESETQRRAPVTEYFFWPRNDAWDEVKAAMETKPYISERQRIDLLNKVTQVIRLWENDEQGRLPIEEARAAMPEISFVGS
eukprot:jgi/Astpho2/1453/Aster-06302